MRITITSTLTCRAKNGGRPGMKPNPMSKRQQYLARPKLHGGKRGPRPQVWVTGPDEYKHDMYHPWQLSSAQARFRNEGWDLTFQEYYTIWAPHWPNRGRKSHNVCMTRKDWDDAWTWDNVEIVSRQEHLQRQRSEQLAGRVRNTASRPAKKQQTPKDKRGPKMKPGTYANWFPPSDK